MWKAHCRSRRLIRIRPCVLWGGINRGTVRRSDGSQARLDAIAAQTLAELPARNR